MDKCSRCEHEMILAKRAKDKYTGASVALIFMMLFLITGWDVCLFVGCCIPIIQPFMD